MNRVPIENIKVKKRIRQDPGDLNSLMESLAKYGMIHPILINEDHELIAGFRRLESAKGLGWNTVPVTIVESSQAAKQIELEIEENQHRKNFTEEELQIAFSRLNRIKNPGFLKKLWNKIIAFFNKLFNRN